MRHTAQFLLVLTACGSSSQDPSIQSFTAVPGAVFVGDRAQITAVFDGDAAEITGIGPVESGQVVTTGVLARSTTFTLTVHRGDLLVTSALVVPARYRDRIRALPAASIARTQHLAVALPDGGAIVLGGNASDEPNVPDSESSQRFDPGTEMMRAGPPLAFTALDRDSTLIVPLAGGDFLLAGGGPNALVGTGFAHRATQRLDVAGLSFGRASDLSFSLGQGSAAVTLADGGALISGGPGISAVQRYHPDDQTWKPAHSLPATRRGHAATRLLDGRVLVTGGFMCCVPITGGQREFAATSALIYDPATDAFSTTGDLATPRAFHEATLLADGRVLVTGGLGEPDDPSPTAAELYDPATGRFTSAGSLTVGRALHGAIRLTDGRVLVIGGADAATLQSGIEPTDVYDPATNRWTDGPRLQPALPRSTVTLLSSGKLLIFGGEDAGGFPRPDVLLYE